MILTNRAAAADGRSMRPDEMISAYSREGRLHEILFIVPTNRRKRALEFELISQSPRGACANLRVHTINSFTETLLNQSRVPFQAVPEAAAILLLHECFQDITREGYFSKYRDFIPEGILRVLRQLFANWKRHLLSPEEIRAQIEPAAPEFEKEKLAAIIQLYGLYCGRLAQHSFHEAGDIAALFLANADAARDAFGKLFPDVKKILVRGYSDFSPAEISLLASFRGFEGTETFIDLDFHARNSVLFGHIKETADCFTAAGFRELPELRPQENAFIERIKSRLFLFDMPVAPARMRLYKLEAGSKENEIRSIAKIIRRLITEEGVHPSAICVCINLIREYSALIRSVFGAAGIPYTLTDRPLLATSPVVTAIIHFLEIHTSRYYYHTICKAFSGGFFTLRHSSVSDILSIAARQRVISEYAGWMDAVSARDGDDGASDGKWGRQLQNCKKDIQEIHARLEPFARPMKPAEFANAFDELIFSMNLANNITGSRLEESTFVFSAVNGLRSLVKELCAILERTMGRDTEYHLAYYLKQIIDSVSYVRYTVIQPPRDTVLLTTPEEIRGLPFDYLFIAGLYDGNFPSRYIPEIFSPKVMARDESRYIADQQYLFYQTLCSSRKALYFSFPSAGGKKDIFPSVFLNAVERLFTMEPIDAEALRNVAVDDSEIAAMAGRRIKNGTPLDDITAFLAADAESLLSGHHTDISRIEGRDSAREYSGILNTEHLGEAAVGHLHTFSEREYSISQLESYMACPFQYFLRRVLNITTPDIPDEDETRMEMGTVLHNIFFEYYNPLPMKERELSGLSDAEKQAALSRLFSIAEKIINETPEGQMLGSWDREVILGIHGNRQASILAKFFEAECREPGTVPALLEAGFGRLSAEALEREGGGIEGPVMLGEVKLTGKIDRVDINSANKTYNVIDYKKSYKAAKFSQNAMAAGLYLQLPVYLHAAGELLRAHGLIDDEWAPFLPAIYGLQYRSDQFGKKYLISSKEKEEEAKAEDIREKARQLIQTAQEHISRSVINIVEGKFRLTELEGEQRKNFACGYCEYSLVCRVDETGGAAPLKEAAPAETPA